MTGVQTCALPISESPSGSLHILHYIIYAMQSSKEITDKAKEYGLLTSLYSEIRTDQKTIQHNLSRTCSVPTP